VLPTIEYSKRLFGFKKAEKVGGNFFFQKSLFFENLSRFHRFCRIYFWFSHLSRFSEFFRFPWENK
jgi:hypothetical protein